MNVLITGASGFVGSALVANLSHLEKFKVSGSVRKSSRISAADARVVEVGDIDGNTSWQAALQGIDVVIHTAARVHVMHDSVNDPLAEFRQVNVAGSLNLARQAITAGVKRFVYLSSIKVNGERTLPGKPYTADDKPQPSDPYGISKAEAEQELRCLTEDSTMDLVIIRPPLVYGPGVRANFLSMMCWLWRGVPLPFAMTRNKRSFVALGNLVDLITTCIDSAAASNKIFLVSDGDDLSTSELLRAMGQALSRPARLFPVPVSLMTVAARIIGKPAIAQRLFESLQVDISATRQTLNWSPPLSVGASMKETADDFIAAGNKT
ncbi:SDR family oxidoreductase [Gammaproteobacteria bacterium]|nr:SDR family oxidoreductase [Gammaproteobacteria bacterium]